MKPRFEADYGYIYLGNALDVLKEMPSESVHCCVTSPPYWGLRDYGVDEQIGLEASPEEYVSKIVEVFREVRRVLRVDGTLWVNLGDSYSSGGRTTTTVQTVRGNCSQEAVRATNTRPPVIDSVKAKDLVGVPWMTAFALRADGWYLRSDIIWHKPNPMPESVTDRPTKSHEYLFLMSKSWRYYYDAGAIKEESVYPNDDRVSRSNESQKRMPTELHAGIRPRIKSRCYPKRNKRSVWTVATQPFSGAHFATFPPSLIEPCVLAGCPVGGTVLDPFFGAGTTGVVSYKLDRKFIGIELSQKYLDEIAIPRIKAEAAQLKLFASGT